MYCKWYTTDIFQGAVDSNNIGGYEKVCELAECLFSVKDNTCLGQVMVDRLIKLYKNLDPYDKPLNKHKINLNPPASGPGSFKFRESNTVR